MLQPDYRALFERGPCSNLILLPDLRIVAVTDAYLSATMTKREDIVGRALFDVFPDDPEDPEADGEENLRASLRHVLLHKLPHRMQVQRYAIRRPPSQGGTFEERYWSPVNTPILGKDGEVEFIIHYVEDVTDVVRLKREKLAQAHSLDEEAARSERYRELIDSAPDATVIIGEDARIQLVNNQTERLFGYMRDELLGKPLELLIPERFRRQHAGHMSRFFANPTARPMGSSLELFGRRKDGTEIPIEVSLSPQRGESHGVVSASIRDISERKRLEAAARLTADRLASAVDAIQDAFALFDGEDRLILCNSVYRRLLHESVPGALVGKTFQELLSAWIHDMDFPDEQSRERYRAERLTLRRREQTTSLDVKLRDGRKLRVIDRRTPEGGIVKTIWDITQDERQAEELREARAAAEAASAAKSEFLSSMSHELRTPLNAILGFAQLLRRDKKEPLSQRHLDRVAQILHGGEHLLRLIDDVLDLARIEAGRVTMFVEPVNLTPVLHEVMATLEPIAQRREVQVGIRQDGEHEPWPLVGADRTRLAQILLNLGSNAIKYNRTGGSVTFFISHQAPDALRIAVRDTGVGIPVEKQDKLFQPFQRAGQETGPIEGTGIGLVITKQLAELMGGSVGFESVPGVGSEFWLELPCSSSPQTSGLRLPSNRPPKKRFVTQREQHIALYVEDNPANVSFMRDLMSAFEGLDLLTVPTAEMGIELARERRPSLIIMDINLPGLSGVDALSALREAPDTREIPVIALTAAASERDKQLGLRAGFYRYLTKPVKVDELIRVVEGLLAPDRPSRPAPVHSS